MTRTRVMARRRSRKRPTRSREALPPSLPEPRLAGEAHRLFGRPEKGFRLVDAFLLLGSRVGIVDDARARLHGHAPVFDHGGAQHDAGVHLAVGAEIADA